MSSVRAIAVMALRVAGERPSVDNMTASPRAAESMRVAGTLRASKRGDVYSRIRGRWVKLRPYKDRGGYRIVKLRLNGARRGFMVSRIVWTYFIKHVAHQTREHERREDADGDA